MIAMTYSIDDITELIRHDLVLSATNNEQAESNLRVLLRHVERMLTARPAMSAVQWMICDGCGASVSSELIDADGAGHTDDGSFRCSSCR
jgi:hypothetical protein